MSPDCEQFLKAAGINPQDVINAVNAQRPFDASKSTISVIDSGTIDFSTPEWQTLQSNDPERARRIADQSVSHYYKSSPFNAVTGIYPGGVQGATLADRSDVYFRPGGWLWFSRGGLQPRTILHEALHSLTGLGDDKLAQKLGLNVGPGQSASAAISQALKKHDCI